MSSRANPMCWLCGAFQQPVSDYRPLICPDCLPGYKERKFVFARPSQEEMEALFSTKKGMTCM